MAGQTGGGRIRVDVGGRGPSLSNPHKQLYPAPGFPKAAVGDYYPRIAPAMLPHPAGRPPTRLPAPPGGPGAQVDHDKTKEFALALGQLLVARDKKRVTVEMAKADRKGKVFVDWSQNDRHKTTVCAYSLRIAERPTVSTPVSWTEIEHALDVE